MPLSSQTSSLGAGGAPSTAQVGQGGPGGAEDSPALYSPVRAHPTHAHHPPPEQDIEIFAKDHLNFSKGIFRKKVSALAR